VTITPETLIGLIVGALIGGLVKFGFDRWSVRMGWAREDKRDQDRKISLVDQQARDSIARLSDRLNTTDGKVEVLKERVDHLPSADDIEAVKARLSEVDRQVSGVAAQVQGMSTNVKTILDHILASERRP